MPYGLIVLAASVALAVLYVFVTDAPLWSKALVTGLLLLSFVWRYGMFLQVALGLFLSLYFTYLEAAVIHAWCQWCVMSAILMTLIFLAALPEARRFRRG